ncbi:hypothetical protein SAMN04488107_0412 [Geodermatophilus saharensis]|uniref:Uncharacterized protein n=1 Tax=Geodermatophilus saharensis TaxID=1137994 RepID=A0A238ZXZ0_9ACTN|nr:hypothetical protein [Geodermatophilus saharensis]SNR88002.1 hypothetical protein SAMN04488107_0412 [Geodermatophilus saharensis]
MRKLYAVRTAVVHTVWEDAVDGPGGMRPVWSNAGVAEHPLDVADLTRTIDRITALCGDRLDRLLQRIDELAPGLRPEDPGS